MKKLLLLLLFQCGMILGNDAKPDCEKRAFDYCPEMKPKLEFPASEEDINKACPVIMSRLECIHSHDEMCPEKESRAFESGHYERFQSVVGDVCDKNSLLHKVISQNINCIQQAVMTQNETCFHPKREVYEAYERYRSELSEEEMEEKDGAIHCLMSANDVACVAGKISQQCGAMAKFAMLDILRRGILREGKLCTAQYSEDALHMIDDLELSSEIRNQVKELLELV